jgi:hypothetical protein
MNRRGFLLSYYSAVTMLAPALRGADSSDPWSDSELIEPQELAAVITSQHPVPLVYCVAFPVLYRGSRLNSVKYRRLRPE